jgi:hypothetical protein
MISYFDNGNKLQGLLRKFRKKEPESRLSIFISTDSNYLQS